MTVGWDEWVKPEGQIFTCTVLALARSGVAPSDASLCVTGWQIPHPLSATTVPASV